MAFVKGQSGNPNGRAPRAVEDAKKSTLERLLTGSVEQQMVQAMINKVINEGDVTAFKALMERKYGKPVALVEEKSDTIIQVEYV